MADITANARVYFAQFSSARFIYRTLMRALIVASRLGKSISQRLARQARYPDEALFPLSVLSARSIALNLVDRDFLFSRYGLSGASLDKAIEEILDLPSSTHLLDPNAYFDSDWYKSSQEMSGIGLTLSPFVHFLVHGRDLALDPSPLFSTADYLRLNPELRKSRLNLLYHYLKYGISESKPVSELELQIRVAESWKKLAEDFSSTVTILIPVFNNWLWTDRALQSVFRNLGETVAEVIVVDDCSTDGTLENLSNWYPNVRVMANSANLGFLASCNKAFETLFQEKARFIYLLNNDAEVLPNFLVEPLRLMSDDDTVGMVGSKLIYPDGSLQEAGGIVWRDATAWNYGRGDSALDAKYTSLREADYLSGASILLRVQALERAGFFDDRFLPAYYEDTDLAFSLRQLGYRTVYCPQSVVIHHEGKSHGSNVAQGVKRSQVDNKIKFENKWASVLKNHLRPDPFKSRQASLRLDLNAHRKTVLWVDYQLPDPTKDSGSVRAIELVKLVRDLGVWVLFVPANGDVESFDPVWLQRHGITICRTIREASRLLRQLERNPDFIWLSRWSVAETFLHPLVKRYPQAKTIFDTVDLHFLRLRREAELKGSQSLVRLAELVERKELSYVKRFDVTLVVSSAEKDLLENTYGFDSVKIVSNVHGGSEVQRSRMRLERKGLIFVGSFNHHPNESGIIWFFNDVWPLLPERVKREGLKVVGPNPSKRILAMESENVRVLGWVESSFAEVSRARISIAPLLVGAGVKGKIGEAILAQTPVVTTGVGAEGMGLAHRVNAMIGENAIEFAKGIVLLFDEKDLALNITTEANKILAEKFSPSVAKRALQEVFETNLLSPSQMGAEE